MEASNSIEIPDAIVKRAAESHVFNYEFVAPDWEWIADSVVQSNRESELHSVILREVESGRYFRTHYRHYLDDDMIQIHALALASVEVFPRTITTIVYETESERPANG